MATLTGSTIASSYDQLLALPSGGGNGATLVALTDGNAGNTFALKLSTGEVNSTGTLTAAGAATLSTSVTLATGATVTGIDNGGLATGSATLLATQGAIKTYVDAQVGASDTLAEVLANGGTATSSALAGVMSDETGSGSLVFATSPTLVTPALGTPASGVATNLTGTAASLTAGTVTTNANLTGDVTSSGNATSIAAGVIVDADVKSDAAIAYSKLGTIPTWNQDTTGTAATVTGATQAAITSAANLVTVGTIGTGVWQGTAVDGTYVDLEGTEVKSTGETGGTKFLREDGDGTSSWQTVAGDIEGVTAGTNLNGGGTSGTVTLNLDTTITGLTSVTSTDFVGDLTGDVTGNCSGTAATVTGAAQTAITSVGTLSSLVVTGDLTVDTDTLYVDSGNDRVGIGTTSFRSGGILQVDGGSGSGYLDINSATDLNSGVRLYENDVFKWQIFNDGNASPTSDSLLIDHSTGTAVSISQSGNVGIGATPSQKLHVAGNAIITGIARLGDGSEASPAYQFGSDTNTGIWRPSSDAIAVSTGGSERMRIDSSGNVSIGTATAVSMLTVEGSVTLKEQAAADTDTAAYGQIWVKTGTPNTLYFTDDAGTDVQLGAGGGGSPAGSDGQLQYNNSSAFGGDSKLSWDDTNSILSVDGQLEQAVHTITPTTDATKTYNIPMNLSGVQKIICNAANADITFSATEIAAGRTVTVLIDVSAPAAGGSFSSVTTNWNDNEAYDDMLSGTYAVLNTSNVSNGYPVFIVKLTAYGSSASDVYGVAAKFA